MMVASKKSRDLGYYFSIFWKILCTTTIMQSFLTRAKYVRELRDVRELSNIIARA